MELWTSLCSAILWNAVLALGIPQTGAQQPLLPTQRAQAHSYATGVILGFTESGSNQEHRFEIPLRAQISSGTCFEELEIPKQVLTPQLGVDLPGHLKTIKIIAATNQQGQSAPLESLSRIICRVIPKISMEEKEMGEQRVWPWFTAEDAVVRFEASSSRWYLAGRSIERFECR
ncbi:uncharacterized protein K460DRAFT_368770 [Cucurbitaria berberidis CBS 394.84]|uniref:Ubiquitin 3 binding protein But2 C-terminal domain-containing protein n=1 Tax=Cucurbitaria berberidis CBS 394.84 TaxID=1168544 RepID=A0A9P4GE20_9PLEO|nr:uncharacterized protein K460DRAFT_368770 [Cucurbitaria berberidis CBS 394.84]KAF1843902.1 hypothetical protein K460DRAFT_368770 [Cucurbitaria berberidis CBS 394.84]